MDTSHTPEKGAHSQSWPSGLLVIIIIRSIYITVQHARLSILLFINNKQWKYCTCCKLCIVTTFPASTLGSRSRCPRSRLLPIEYTRGQLSQLAVNSANLRSTQPTCGQLAVNAANLRSTCGQLSQLAVSLRSTQPTCGQLAVNSANWRSTQPTCGQLSRPFAMRWADAVFLDPQLVVHEPMSSIRGTHIPRDSQLNKKKTDLVF
jgi:hypothetical protein